MLAWDVILFLPLSRNMCLAKFLQKNDLLKTVLKKELICLTFFILMKFEGPMRRLLSFTLTLFKIVVYHIAKHSFAVVIFRLSWYPYVEADILTNLFGHVVGREKT